MSGRVINLYGDNAGKLGMADGTAAELHFVVAPEWNNEGEDLNWVSWYAIGHVEEIKVSREGLAEQCREFCKLPVNDEGNDEWCDIEPEERGDNFMMYLAEREYVVIKCAGVRWIGERS